MITGELQRKSPRWKSALIGAGIGAFLPALGAVQTLRSQGDSDGGSNVAFLALLFGVPFGAVSGGLLGWCLAYVRHNAPNKAAAAKQIGLVGLVIGIVLSRFPVDLGEKLLLIACITGVGTLIGLAVGKQRDV